MLPPPEKSAINEVIAEIDEMVAGMREALREHYRTYGMTAPLPPSVMTRQRGDLIFHASAALAEQEKKKAEMEKLVIPPGVNLTSSPRVSGEMRDRYLNHLHETCGDEYIDLTEANARIDAAMAARTEDELKLLIQDLPALPEESKDVIEFTAPVNKNRLFADGVEKLVFALMATTWALFGPASGPLGRGLFVLASFIAIHMWALSIRNFSASRNKKTSEKNR